MHSVGNINREIYKCITDDIVTDEVVLTDNQVKHIMERHPDAYEEAIKDIKTVIENQIILLQMINI